MSAFGGHVTGYKVDPHYDLPSLVVSVADADDGGDRIEPELQVKSAAETHSIAITLEIRDKQTGSMDTALDALCLAVEQKIENGPEPLPDPEEGEPEPEPVVTLTDLVRDLELVNTTYEIEGGDTEQEVGLARIVYQGNYRINRGARETII